MTKCGFVLSGCLEAAGTQVPVKEENYLESHLETSVWWSKMLAETKDLRREEIWQEVSKQGNGSGKWAWKGSKEKLRKVGQRRARTRYAEDQ